MTDKLIATDGTSSGLSAGAAISDTDYIELQQSVVSPASTVNSQFSAVKTWIRAWITQSDVSFTGLTSAAAASDTDTFPTNQGAGNLKQTLAAIKTWVKNWMGWPIPIYIANNWYEAGDAYANTFGSNGVVQNGHIIAYPAFFHGPATITALGVRINTASAGGKMAVAIYDHNPATFRPTGTALVTSGDLSTTGTGAVASGAVSLAITGPKILWFCTNSDNGTAAASGTFSALMAAIGGTATQANLSAGSARLSYLSYTQAYASGWPDLTSGSPTENQSGSAPPTVQFKIGSVP